MQDRKGFSKGSLLEIAKSIGDATKAVGEGAKTAATTLSSAVKENKSQLDVKIAQKKLESDLKKYAPIQREWITSPDFALPPVIRLVGDDIRRSVKTCKGAIGFYTEGKGLKILNIYREYAELLSGIKWYPLEEEAVYHVDPCHKKLYIRIDEYFAYLKKVRVDELISVAHDLGAKRVEIILKTSHSSATSEQRSFGANIASHGVANGQTSQFTAETSGMEVAAQIEFKGSDHAVKPKIVYFKNEHDIQTLIKMRLSPEQGNALLSKKYSFRYGNSSGVKTDDAQKLDVALSALNIGASHSFFSEATAENNTMLEYYIEF